jgi:hypothetical protein
MKILHREYSPCGRGRDAGAEGARKVGKACEDNPELPLQFIKDTLLALQEANPGQLTPYQFGA